MVKRQNDQTVALFGFCHGIIGTMTVSSELSAYRVAKILKTEPTENTIGIITAIESRNTRGGSKLWAIIEYRTRTGTVTQAIYNPNNRYLIGQKYGVRYAVDYPEMFVLTRDAK